MNRMIFYIAIPIFVASSWCFYINFRQGYVWYPEMIVAVIAGLICLPLVYGCFQIVDGQYLVPSILGCAILGFFTYLLFWPEPVMQYEIRLNIEESQGIAQLFSDSNTSVDRKFVIAGEQIKKAGDGPLAIRDESGKVIYQTLGRNIYAGLLGFAPVIVDEDILSAKRDSAMPLQ